MKYQSFKIDKNYSSIYYFLKNEGFSENFITNLRKNWGNFVLNGTIVNIRASLKCGDELKLNSNPNAKTSIMQCILPLDIVFEDEYYLLINKPKGISCMPNRRYYQNNLAGAICYYMSQKDDSFVLRMLNRLEKDTTGIIIIAKDSISYNKIKNIEKNYIAICTGKIDKNLIINKKIKTEVKEGINTRKRKISSDGQSATTFITPISYNNNYSLIKLNLIHGRTHQIRIHLSSIYHPLIGDELYGKQSDFIDHTALICNEVCFYHPYLNKYLNFKIDLPNDFRNLLKRVELKIN